MTLRLLLIASLVASIPAYNAWAQADVTRSAPGTEAAGSVRTNPIRVESSMSINVPVVAGTSAEAQLKLTESTRLSLYEAAAKECENLKQVFKAECRLQNVRTNVITQACNGRD